MTPTCYLLTSNDRLMPATVAAITESGMVELVSPDGRHYTANPGNIVNTEDAAVMLRQRRAEKLIDAGYLVTKLQGSRYRVFNQKTHGAQGGYIVDMAQQTCTCPDAAKGNECKHLLGAAELIRRAQVAKPVVRIPATVTPKAPIVYGIQPHSAKMAAMIARDGWGA